MTTMSYDLHAICRDASGLDPDWTQNLRDALLADHGRMQGIPHDLRALALALETFYGHGVADQSAGETDFGDGHAIRVGRAILRTDSAGFLELQVCGNERAAAEILDALDAALPED